MNKVQKLIVRELEYYFSFLCNTNDINSPSLYSDIEETVEGLILTKEDKVKVTEALNVILQAIKTQQ